MKRWRAATVALLVLAMVGSLLALAVPPPSVAGAQEPEGVTTATSWATDCAGYAIQVRQPETNAIAMETTAPAQVAQDEEFTVRIAPVASSFPDSKDSLIGLVPVHFLQNINFMYDLPANATVQSVSIVEGSGFGIEGTPSVSISSTPPPFATVFNTPYDPPRIIMQVPKVPKNPINEDLSTPFQLPAIDVVLKATGPLGSNISTRFSGHDEPSSGYVFQASSTAMAEVYCWPAGNVASPVLFQTAITGGGVSVPTTTELEVTPTTVPGGGEVSMTATVNAPSGAVRFNDGDTLLGLAELDEASQAHLTAVLNTVGNRSITATYLGGPGFEGSTSEPVTVTVTNPANREPAQVSVAVTGGGTVNAGFPTSAGTVAVSVMPTGGATQTPTGFVRIYDGDTLIGTQPLSEGTATLVHPFGQGGHQVRVDYLGDTSYFPTSGWGHFLVNFQSGQNLNFSAGTMALNGASGPVPGGSRLNSALGTDINGVESLSGQLVFESSTLTTSSGSVTGRLLQAGSGSGEIAAGADAAAWFSTQLYYQVTEADFGSGAKSFASGCIVGPFPVELTGTRAGIDGELTLSQDDFLMPLAASGSCVDAAGVSRATQVSGVLAGGAADLSVTLTPPGPASPLTITDVSFDPAGGASYGQPVAVSFTINSSGPSFQYNLGSAEFFVDGELFGATTVFGASGTSFTFDHVFPSPPGFGTLALPPLPQGTHSYAVRILPSDQVTFAASPLSAPASFTVLPPVPKATPTLTIEAPAEAAAAEVVDLEVTLSPAPNAAPGTAELEGEILIFDDADGGARVPFAYSFSNSTVSVNASDDGHYTVRAALAPGAHSLRAVFTPALLSEWGWTTAESNVATHTVLGEAVPTSLTLVEDSTRGTGKVPLNSTGYFTFQLDPQVVASIGPAQSVPIYYPRSSDGALVSTSFDSNGRATVQMSPNPTVGVREFTAYFDPFSTFDGNPSFPANRGFAPSQLTVSYEVVAPGPIPTGLEITSVNPSPAVQGTAWSQVNGYVSFNAAGSVSYMARNVSTSQVTALGSANASTSSSSSSGRGLARLSNPAATASLPAGTYEVFGTFTPSNPASFAPSSSEPFTVHVVSAGSPASTTTELTVSPSGTSFPGEGVVLTANVSPTYASGGTVEFFDGEASLGTAPPANGSAQLMVFDLADGPHSLKATFTPSSGVVNGSTSPVVTHTVTEPATETTTSLEVSPSGSVQLGDEVSFTATVSPSDAPGSVLFEDDHGDFAETVPVTDGQASYGTDELEAGTHEVTATFVPSEPTDYAESVSEPVSVTVVSGPVSTETSLEITPGSPAPYGTALTLTASVEPVDAAGAVTFYDGDVPLSDPIGVTGGQAQALITDLPIGDYEINAVFEPTDPELWAPSATEPQAYEITADFGDPIFVCQGTDDVTIGLMKGLVAPPDGILELPTTLEATVPETLTSGATGDVSFAWSVTLPENLAQLAINAQASEIFMEDMTLAMQASGGSEEVWEFPATHTITDPEAPITLETSGTVTASAESDIVYSMRSPLLLTIHVPPTPLVSAHVYVNLSCTVENATQAITQVNGGATAPGAPTDVSAEAGPLMAHVSWTPPADDGGSPITGYVVTASPGGKTTHTSAEVTHVDVIGLEEGQDYTFGVQAVNDVGTGEASEPSNSVTPGPGENFSDVQPDHPFYAEIEWLAATGITTGMSPGFFGADLNLTRQAMAAFLYRLEGSPNGADPECSSMPFTDVSLDNAFCGEIQWLKDEGITTGNPDGTFNPTGNLTRQAMSAFLYRLANGPDTPPVCTVAPYPDVPTSNVFCPQITWMGEVGITTTPPGDDFRPSDSLTRQAMAAFLYRYTTVIPTEL